MIVELEGCSVEIQVRTRLQDLWAQAMETAALMALNAWGFVIWTGLFRHWSS